MNPLHQLLDAADNRILVDANGGVLRNRLDDQGKSNVVAVVERALIAGGEKRSANAVKIEDLLGQGLVLCQKQRLRAGAGVGAAEEIKVGCHVHLLVIIAGVGLHQVEKQIGFAAG